MALDSSSNSSVLRSIPVYIFAGFLGAGKTTLLNHLLQDEHGLKLAVMVNDFGAIPVDAMLMAGQVDDIVSMANGCLCCEVSDGEFDEALTKLVSLPGVEAIVIEASGVVEPSALLAMLYRAQENVAVSLGGLLEVVDAAEIRDTFHQHASVLHRLGDADLIVLNKADLVTAEELEQVQEELRDVAPGVTLITTSRGRVDARVLFDNPHHTAASFAELVETTSASECSTGASAPHSHWHHDNHEHQHAHDHHHLHEEYVTVSVPLDSPLHPARFMDFICRGTAGAYRVKGFIELSGPTEPERFVFEKAGRHMSLRRWFVDGPADSTAGLVFIGADLDGTLIAEECAACTHIPGEYVRPGDLWSFYPYLDDGADEPEDYWQEDLGADLAEDFLVDPEDDPYMFP